MINLRNSPFLWLALLLLAAYGLAERLDNTLLIRLSPALLVLIVISGLTASGSFYARFRYVPTIALSMMIFAMGIWNQVQFTNNRFPDPLLNTPIKMHGELEVIQVLKTKTSASWIQCRIIDLRAGSNSDLVLTDQYILLLIRDPGSVDLFPYDRIILEGWVSAITAPLNPDAFDPRTYYLTLGIRHQISANGSDLVIHPFADFSIVRLTAKWQKLLSDMVRAHTSPEVAQVITALVWGDRTDMASDVRQAFANSGAMHVLSVSGMHVAMIYSMLLLLLGAPGDGMLFKRIVRFVMYALAILFYVALTGACPAVVRAGLMILLFLFGKALGWNAQVWNLLGFAAFIMLWVNPYVWHNIGFQLSFLAMAGILMYAKPVMRTFSFKFKLWQWVWDIIALSIAAQIFIVPVLLAQFHQFPLTFIISSIVAIPAGYLIIFGAILNVLLSCFHFDLLWPLLDRTGYYFIRSMEWMAELNPDMNFSLPAPAGWCLMAMSIFFTAALLYSWPVGKKLAYAAGSMAFVILAMHRQAEWSGDELIVYHTYSGILIDVSQAGHCISILDGNLTHDQVDFAARRYRCRRDFIHVVTVSPFENLIFQKIKLENSMLTLPGYSLSIFNNRSAHVCAPDDYSWLLVEDADSMGILQHILCRSPDLRVILPASLPRSAKRKLTRLLIDHGSRYYDISQSGYFRLGL